MSTHLDFRQRWTPPAASALLLEFRPAQVQPPAAVAGTLRGVLGAPSATAQAMAALRVPRPTTAQTGATWRGAQPNPAHVTEAWRDTARLRLDSGQHWQNGAALLLVLRQSVTQLVPHRNTAMAEWHDAQRIDQTFVARFAPLQRLRTERVALFESAASHFEAWRSGFVQLVPTRTARTSFFEAAKSNSTVRTSAFSVAIKTRTEQTHPWDRARQPPPGQSVPPNSGPVTPPTIRPSPNLNFCCPSSQIALRWLPTLKLNFTKRPCVGGVGGVVPTLKVYFVSNSVTVVRLPGREAVAVKSISVTIDADSWAWGFTASIPLTALELVEPSAAGPVEIEITVNGITWIMLVEGFDLRREFGASEANLRGRSVAAYLAEPYAPKRSFTPSFPFTARQLAEQELDRATLATGFDLDGQLPDWLVPAGAWSYESLTPMQVIARIVESVGGSLNAHPQLKRLIAQSRYPSLPWEWASQTPHRTLHIDVVKTLSARWSEKPELNAVYVGGEREGIIALVRRSGTAGDQLAPIIIDPLITHADAARERGRAVLADTGRQAMVTLELPMLPSIGLLEPGRLIAIGESGASWRGLVRGTTVSANWSQSLLVRQVVEVERRL